VSFNVLTEDCSSEFNDFGNILRFLVGFTHDFVINRD
jgi:hypothetical protein